MEDQTRETCVESTDKMRMDNGPFISFYLKNGLPNAEFSHWNGRLKTQFAGWQMLRGHTFGQSQVQYSCQSWRLFEFIALKILVIRPSRLVLCVSAFRSDVNAYLVHKNIFV